MRLLIIEPAKGCHPSQHDRHSLIESLARMREGGDPKALIVGDKWTCRVEEFDHIMVAPLTKPEYGPSPLADVAGHFGELRAIQRLDDIGRTAAANARKGSEPPTQPPIEKFREGTEPPCKP